MFVGGVDAVDSSTGNALWAAFTIHLDANARFGRTEHSGSMTGTACPSSWAVIRAATETLAKKIIVMTWACIQAWSIMSTLLLLVLDVFREKGSLTGFA